MTLTITDERIEAAYALLKECTVCPRLCGAARLDDEPGVCQGGASLRVASWNLHHGEEPPISGTRGSGTIFLSGCSMRCVYCQNYPISQHGAGTEMSVGELAAVMGELESDGAHNINFVTPTHYTPQILEAVLLAREQGLTIPIVWNTSGYERVETLRLLDGVVDVYLADMRYGEDSIGRRYSKIPDYATVNRTAIAEMHRQVGDLQIDGEGIATRGLLVRHLVLPAGISGSRRIFEFLAREISPATWVSVMSQYFPAHRAVGHSLLGRRITRAEYAAAQSDYSEAGLFQGFQQDLE